MDYQRNCNICVLNTGMDKNILLLSKLQPLTK